MDRLFSTVSGRLASAVSVALGGLMLSAGISHAADSSAFSLRSVQANAIAAFQGGGNTFSGQLGWSPRYSLSSELGVRGIVAGSLFKGNFDDRFFVAEFQALASYQMSQWMLEAGGGAQIWFGQDVTSPMASAAVSWLPTAPMFGMIDRYFVGYSYLLSSAVDTHQVKAGIGISF